jgi:hypothetical protein
VKADMDPVQVRFVQLLIAEILGVILCLGGLVLLFLGAAGKIGLLMQGPGVKAKLTNASPGLVVAIIGVVLISFSLKGTIRREEVGTIIDADAILKGFSQNAAALQKQSTALSYSAAKDAILGPEPIRKIVSSTNQLKHAETLKEISQKAYGHDEYWPLVALINMDRGYFDFGKATAETSIPAGQYVEIWQISRFYGQTSKTILALSGPAIEAANEELLHLALQRAKLDVPALQDRYRAQELTLVYGQADTSDLRSVRELAIKYYGDAKFWPILVWTNSDILKGATGDTNIPVNEQLSVLHFIQ